MTKQVGGNELQKTEEFSFQKAKLTLFAMGGADSDGCEKWVEAANNAIQKGELMEAVRHLLRAAWYAGVADTEAN